MVMMAKWHPVVTRQALTQTQCTMVGFASVTQALNIGDCLPKALPEAGSHARVQVIYQGVSGVDEKGSATTGSLQQRDQRHSAQQTKER